MKIKQIMTMKELCKLQNAVYMQDTIFFFPLALHGSLSPVESCPYASILYESRLCDTISFLLFTHM